MQSFEVCYKREYFFSDFFETAKTQIRASPESETLTRQIFLGIKTDV